MTPTSAQIHPYIGNGPYCYTNSLVAVLGPDAPAPAIVETLTGSAFGFQLLAGAVPLFDPYGWNPDLGLDQAIGLLGYSCDRHIFDSATAALAALREHVGQEPVLVGPVDMGLLAHQPGSDRASGADHFVVALEVTDTEVVFHDPQGHPWAALPIEKFCDAWRADGIGYLDGHYPMRTGFRRTAEVSAACALQASLPQAAQWLQGRRLPVPPGTLGGREGLENFAERIDAGLGDSLAEMLTQFGIRLGARRKTDAADCLMRIGEERTAELLLEQARVLGGLQFPAMVRDWHAMATGVRRLAQLHDMTADALTNRSADGRPTTDS